MTKKKTELYKRTGKSSISVRHFVRNLKENDLHFDNKQITQCVFLGVLRLKPVPSIFRTDVKPSKQANLRPVNAATLAKIKSEPTVKVVTKPDIKKSDNKKQGAQGRVKKNTQKVKEAVKKKNLIKIKLTPKKKPTKDKPVNKKEKPKDLPKPKMEPKQSQSRSPTPPQPKPAVSDKDNFSNKKKTYKIINSPKKLLATVIKDLPVPEVPIDEVINPVHFLINKMKQKQAECRNALLNSNPEQSDNTLATTSKKVTPAKKLTTDKKPVKSKPVEKQDKKMPERSGKLEPAKTPKRPRLDELTKETLMKVPAEAEKVPKPRGRKSNTSMDLKALAIKSETLDEEAENNNKSEDIIIIPDELPSPAAIESAKTLQVVQQKPEHDVIYVSTELSPKSLKIKERTSPRLWNATQNEPLTVQTKPDDVILVGEDAKVPRVKERTSPRIKAEKPDDSPKVPEKQKERTSPRTKSLDKEAKVEDKPVEDKTPAGKAQKKQLKTEGEEVRPQKVLRKSIGSPQRDESAGRRLTRQSLKSDCVLETSDSNNRAKRRSLNPNAKLNPETDVPKQIPDVNDNSKPLSVQKKRGRKSFKLSEVQPKDECPDEDDNKMEKQVEPPESSEPEDKPVIQSLPEVTVDDEAVESISKDVEETTGRINSIVAKVADLEQDAKSKKASRVTRSNPTGESQQEPSNKNKRKSLKQKAASKVLVVDENVDKSPEIEIVGDDKTEKTEVKDDSSKVARVKPIMMQDKPQESEQGTKKDLYEFDESEAEELLVLRTPSPKKQDQSNESIKHENASSDESPSEKPSARKRGRPKKVPGDTPDIKTEPTAKVAKGRPSKGKKLVDTRPITDFIDLVNDKTPAKQPETVAVAVEPPAAPSPIKTPASPVKSPLKSPLKQQSLKDMFAAARIKQEKQAEIDAVFTKPSPPQDNQSSPKENAVDTTRQKSDSVGKSPLMESNSQFFDGDGDDSDYDDDTQSNKEWLPEDYAEYKMKFSAKKIDAYKAIYKCKVCLKLCSSYYRLNKHKRTHEALEKPYECPTCSESFSVIEDFNAHLRAHKGKLRNSLYNFMTVISLIIKLT